MDEHGSVTHWIHGLCTGDPDAARRLWDRYYQRIVGVARRKLGTFPRRDADEEDLALSVFRSLCAGAAEGQFSDLFDRDDLWPLLVHITHQKVVDQIRHATRRKRGGGNVRGDSIVAGDPNDEGRGFDQFASDAPTPEFLAELREQLAGLFEALRDDGLKQITALLLEGHSNDEIAEKLGITTRSVERKRRLIRETLSRFGEMP